MCDLHFQQQSKSDMDPLLVNRESGKYSKQDRNEVIMHTCKAYFIHSFIYTKEKTGEKHKRNVRTTKNRSPPHTPPSPPPPFPTVEK